MYILPLFKLVRTFVFDVDGVLTDGTLFVLGDQFVRRMHIRDGFALQLAVKKGYRVAVISGSHSDAVTDRLNRLGVQDVFMHVTNKKEMLADYCHRYQLDAREILFMGDDIPDYAVMQEVGLPCAPADAAPEIKRVAKYISPLTGGSGCVRDVIEKVLKLNDHWELETDTAAR